MKKKKKHFHSSSSIVCTLNCLCTNWFKDFIGLLVLGYKYLGVNSRTFSNGSFLYIGLMCQLLSQVLTDLLPNSSSATNQLIILAITNSLNFGYLICRVHRTYLICLLRILNEIMNVKCLSKCLACYNHSINSSYHYWKHFALNF